MIRSVRRTFRARAALLTSAFAIVSSCGLPAEDSEPSAGESNPAAPQGKNAAALTRATSCEDVLERIQADTIARLVERAEELRQPPEAYTGEPVVVIGGDDVLPPPSSPSRETLGDNPLLSGGAVAPESDASLGTPSGGPGFSDTTAQVREVDEADVIKADGDFLYVLQGSSLVKLRAWPADQMQTVAAASIEGSPYDMFVSDGRAVVFSSVSRDLLGTDQARGGGYYGYYYYPTVTKVTVLDVAAETPAVLRESFLEGYYVASRRHDDIVRAVIQDN